MAVQTVECGSLSLARHSYDLLGLENPQIYIFASKLKNFFYQNLDFVLGPAPGQAGHSSWRNGKEAAELIDNVYNAFSNGRVSVRDSDGHWLSEEALKAEPVYPVTRSLG